MYLALYSQTKLKYYFQGGEKKCTHCHPEISLGGDAAGAWLCSGAHAIQRYLCYMQGTAQTPGLSPSDPQYTPLVNPNESYIFNNYLNINSGLGNCYTPVTTSIA